MQNERQKQSADIPKWSALLVEAVNEPGMIMKAYSAFWNYSVGNQILALIQANQRGIALGPIASFNRWKELGRYVKRGEKAIELCMPVTSKRTVKEQREDGSEAASGAHVSRLSRRSGPDQQPHQDAEIVASDVDQVALVNIVAPAQPGPAHAAAVEVMGEGSLDDFRPPPHRLLADRRTQAGAVCVDRRTGFVVAVPA